jgi:hypothetical protein
MDGTTLWFVAAGLYIYDSVALRPSCIVLRHAIGGTSALIVEPLFVIARKSIFIPSPLRPDRCDLPLTANFEGRRLQTDERYLIDRGGTLYLPHQLSSIAAGIVLFALFPLFARNMSLLYAGAIAFALILIACLPHWLAMWTGRKLHGVTGADLRADIFHVLLCPPNAVNSARRIAALRHCRYDALATLRAFSPLDAQIYSERGEAWDCL